MVYGTAEGQDKHPLASSRINQTLKRGRTSGIRPFKDHTERTDKNDINCLICEVCAREDDIGNN
jgi:hypothetical protein